jgi:amidase
MWNDGSVWPTPPVSRALKETVQKLEAAGHEIIEWAPEGHKKAIDLLVRRIIGPCYLDTLIIVGPYVCC